jgi:hypothetical protein
VKAVVSPSRVLFCATALFAVLFSGCSLVGKKVNAYERSTLSKPGMALVENGQEQSSLNHMYNAREGSEGGFGGAGGGCGCN